LPPGVLGRLGQVAKLNPYRRLKPRPLYVPLLLQSVPGHLGQVAKLNPYLASWRTGPVSPLEQVLPLLVVVEKVVGIKIRALTPRYFGGLRIDFECRLFDNCTALVILLLLLIAPLLIYSFLLIAHFPLLLLIAHFHSPLLCARNPPRAVFSHHASLAETPPRASSFQSRLDPIQSSRQCEPRSQPQDVSRHSERRARIAAVCP